MLDDVCVDGTHGSSAQLHAEGRSCREDLPQCRTHQLAHVRFLGHLHRELLVCGEFEYERLTIGVHVDLSITPTANTWTQIDVPLDGLGTTQVTYLYWFNATAGAQATFSIDDVAFVASGLPTPTPPGPVAGPALQVDVANGRHPISDFIYGMNFADEALATALRLPVRRWGGNATTRYNWRTDTSNHASDWYFENIPNDNPNPAALPDGSSSDRFVEENLRAGAETLLTVPLIPSALPRSPCGKTALVIAMPLAMSIEAPTAWTTRKAMSASALGAAPQRAEPRVNTTNPAA